MIHQTRRLAFAGFLLVLLQTLATVASADSPVPRPEFFGKYCNECHAGDSPEGGLNLATLAFELEKPDNFALWTRIHDRVRDGEMPPRDSQQPSATEARLMLGGLDEALHRASLELQQREGRSLARRLNRDEYQATLRELLGIEADYRPQLPDDGMALGFDKVGSALSISAEHLQAYLAVTRAALDESLPTSERPPVHKEVYLQRWAPEIVGKKTFSLPFGRAFGWKPDALVRFGDFVDAIVGFRRVTIPGTYRFRVHARAWGGETVKARIRAGGPLQADPSWVVAYTEFPPDGRTVEVTAYLTEGETLRVCPIGIAGADTMHRVKYEKGNSAQNYNGPGLAMEWVEVEGPLRPDRPTATWWAWSNPESLSRAGRVDAEKILRTFLPRAFRRPVANAEVEHFLALYDAGAKDGGFVPGIRLALQAALCSPNTLFLDAPPGRLDNFALAERLAYFLWNSPPDEQLVELAATGALSRPEVLQGQVERMLNSPRLEAFIEGFAGQWLDLRKINATTPDRQLYPEWDELLEWSSVRETRSFLEEMLRQDLSVTHLVQSDFAMLNDRLAAHYGIPGVEGIDLRRVTLPQDSVRGGLLSQASILKVTANGTTSSPVLRGVWVRERILGLPVPSPPQGVPAIEPDIRGATSIREQLASHRSIASCAACHRQIDPPGFALESFDVIGGWRDRYRVTKDDGTETQRITLPLTFNTRAFQQDSTRRGPLVATVGLGPSVDASGVLPDGKSFSGYADFRNALARNPDQLARGLAQHLVTYATGVGIQYADRRAIDEIVNNSRARGHGLRSLIHEVIGSPLFLNQ